MTTQKHLTVITHNGIFHSDEVLAVAAIKAFSGREVVVQRTRDLEEIKRMARECDVEDRIVLDVGGKYDPELRLYDHHQRDYDGGHSALGLVWKHEKHRWHYPAAHARIQRLVVDYIDAMDCGVQTYKLWTDDVKPFFLNHIISGFNDSAETSDAAFNNAVNFGVSLFRGMAKGGTREPSGMLLEKISGILAMAWNLAHHEAETWQMPSMDFSRGFKAIMLKSKPDHVKAQRILVDRFDTVFARLGNEARFLERKGYIPDLVDVVTWMPLVDVLAFLEGVFQRCSAAARQQWANEKKMRVLVQERKHPYVVEMAEYFPWKEALEKADPNHEVHRIIHPAQGGGWMVVCRSKELGGFEMKFPHPEAWRGLNGEELNNVIDNEYIDAKFCHPSGFIAGCETLEGARQMAMQSFAQASIKLK